MIPRAIIKTADCRGRDSEPDAPGLSSSLTALDLDYSQGSPNRCGTGTSFVAVTGGRASHRRHQAAGDPAADHAAMLPPMAAFLPFGQPATDLTFIPGRAVAFYSRSPVAFCKAF
jgi:hypothetical protein